MMAKPTLQQAQQHWQAQASEIYSSDQIKTILAGNSGYVWLILDEFPHLINLSGYAGYFYFVADTGNLDYDLGFATKAAAQQYYNQCTSVQSAFASQPELVQV